MDLLNMNEEKVIYEYGSFIDFKGEEHFITVCALSRSIRRDSEGLCVVNCYSDFVCDINRVVSVGVSICNPVDTQNFSLGEKIAKNKAMHETAPTLYTECCGIVTDQLLEALAKQEVEYVKQNPNKFIKGYNDAWKRWEKRKATREALANLTSEEKQMIELINKGIDMNKCISLANEKMDN